jgi:phospholipase/carboxylesterase
MITSMAGLDVHVLQKSQTAPVAAVILCHGFGAPGDDLVPLAQELISGVPALSAVRFYVPAAPISLGNTGWGEARAWWPINLPTVARLQAGDPAALREFSKAEPHGMPMARQALTTLVNEVAVQTKLPVSRILMGGFSQGAMLATDVTLRLEEAPLGLMVLSGTLLLEDVWAPKAKARAGLQVFQTHGRADPILAFLGAQWLSELLTDAGLHVQFEPFEGGHTIHPDALAKLGAFMARRVGA